MGEVKITNQTISNVNWRGADICLFSSTNQTDIWRIQIGSNLPYIQNFSSIIDANELLKANKYYKAADRDRTLLSRIALRLILGKYLNKDPKELVLRVDNNNKPILTSPSTNEIKFNISYAMDYILIAISPLEVGIDIEYVDPNFEFKDILNEYFTKEEISYVEENNTIDRFFAAWTKKEALAKAIGSGLFGPINQLPTLNGDTFLDGSILNTQNNWIVSSFYIADTHVGSLASLYNNLAITFYDLDLSFFI
jgi:4'-phosphopantetheinyl transferase